MTSLHYSFLFSFVFQSLQNLHVGYVSIGNHKTSNHPFTSNFHHHGAQWNGSKMLLNIAPLHSAYHVLLYWKSIIGKKNLLLSLLQTAPVSRIITMLVIGWWLYWGMPNETAVLNIYFLQTGLNLNQRMNRIEKNPHTFRIFLTAESYFIRKVNRFFEIHHCQLNLSTAFRSVAYSTSLADQLARPRGHEVVTTVALERVGYCLFVPILRTILSAYQQQQQQ